MSIYVEEEIEAGLRVGYKLEKLIHSGRSKFQTVQLVDLEPFGRTLLIDGLIQSTQVVACRCTLLQYLASLA